MPGTTEKNVCGEEPNLVVTNEKRLRSKGRKRIVNNQESIKQVTLQLTYPNGRGCVE